MNKNTNRSSENAKGKREFFAKACHERGLKITPQRVAIYDELVSSDRHPSAIMIHRKIKKYYPYISLGTVNSTLLTFARIGLAKVVESSGDPKRFDAKLEKHHHFRCLRCGKIIDFYYSAYDAMKIPATLNARFVVLERTVHLKGYCETCRDRVRK